MAVNLSAAKLTTTTEKLTLSRKPVINRSFKEMEALKQQGAVFLELRERLQSGLLIIRQVYVLLIRFVMLILICQVTVSQC